MSEGVGEPCILVADDDPRIRDLARRALAPAGFRVALAGDGHEALRLFEAESPSLVLLDVQMPGADGYAVCRAIRSHPSGARTPVVMFTSLEDVASIQKAFDFGATDFVTKPVSWKVLTERLRYMLRAGELVDELSQARRRLAEAQRTAQLGDWAWDASTGVLEGSAEFRRLLHLPEGVALHLGDLLSRVHPLDRGVIRAGLDRAIRELAPLECDHLVQLPDGREGVLHLKALPARLGDARKATLAGVVQDVTSRHRAEEDVRFYAFHDDLTGLGNRRLFREHVDAALATTRRHGGIVPLLFVDLDRFKRVNDTLGHAVGDQLLKQVAARLGKCLRETDVVSRPGGGHASISRLGGDEFMLLLREVDDAHSVDRVARRILDVISAPMRLEDQELCVAASIGVAVAPHDGSDADSLLHRAAAAAQAAKRRGGGTWQVFEPSLDFSDRHSLELETDLRRAVKGGDLHVHYQPRVDLATGVPIGCEALVRWTHPRLGNVSPVRFVPVAEQSGLILPLGEFVLRTACEQAKRWNGSESAPLHISVNLSAQQFQSRRLVDTVVRALKDSGLSPAFLELELTESTLMEYEAVTIEALRELKDLGMTVALDDFGTGYSSLSYLKRFPVDVVKIDRSFVQGLPEDSDDSAIAATIISMAKTLNLRVVAEGVETEAQRAFLSERGCDEMQGFLYSPPVDSATFSELLHKGPYEPTLI